MTCFNEKNQHIGELTELRRFPLDYDTDAVVKWCPECGAVVIYKEIDNRWFGEYYVKMKFPRSIDK